MQYSRAGQHFTEKEKEERQKVQREEKQEKEFEEKFEVLQAR